MFLIALSRNHAQVLFLISVQSMEHHCLLYSQVIALFLMLVFFSPVSWNVDRAKDLSMLCWRIVGATHYQKDCHTHFWDLDLRKRLDQGLLPIYFQMQGLTFWQQNSMFWPPVDDWNLFFDIAMFKNPAMFWKMRMSALETIWIVLCVTVALRSSQVRQYPFESESVRRHIFSQCRIN